MMPDSVLEVERIATGYGDLRAVWDVSLRVGAGEVTALLGRNGAGKTTVLRALAGLNRLNDGHIRLDGRDMGNAPPYARVAAGIAYVQEGKRIFRSLSVEDNLVLGGHSRRLGRRALAADADEKYEMFPILGERRRDQAGALSGGQQQMLAIATALMGRPKILMLDEPSAGLAPTIVGDVLNAIAAMKSAGLALLLVEQAVDFALAVADDVVVIDLGRVVLSGHAREKTLRKSVLKAYEGLTTAV
jgi:branched-chain amino acid transport system ATP-binding protein